MKIIVIALAFVLPLAAQESNPQAAARQAKTSSKNVAATPKAPPTPPEVPKGAKKIAPGEWRWTDKEGQVWIFRLGPFGINKIPLESGPPQQEAVAPDRAEEFGDEVEFSRPTPFGVHKWRKKKTDLDAGEKIAWERTQAAAKAKGGSEAKKPEQP